MISNNYRGIRNTNPPLIRSGKGNLRKSGFALIEAGQNFARRRLKFLTFRRGDPLEIDQFGCLPEYKLVTFGAHFAGIEAGRQFPEI